MQSLNLVKQLRDEEGEVLHAYQDHLGYWTIGCGHLIDKRKGGSIPRRISDLLLEGDINDKASELDSSLPWWRDMDEARQGVLLGMAFQLGTAGLLGFKNTLAMVKSGDYDGASRGMLSSKWATQTPARAKRMSEQMRTGIWQWKS